MTPAPDPDRSHADHRRRVDAIAASVRAMHDASGPAHIAKGGVHHVVPLPGDARFASRPIDTSQLTHIIEIDPVEQRCVAEPGVTFEELVRATLPLGLAPAVVPELRGSPSAGPSRAARSSRCRGSSAASTTRPSRTKSWAATAPCTRSPATTGPTCSRPCTAATARSGCSPGLRFASFLPAATSRWPTATSPTSTSSRRHSSRHARWEPTVPRSGRTRWSTASCMRRIDSRCASADSSSTATSRRRTTPASTSTTARPLDSTPTS
ncbi:MAG: FAD-binding protein [Actinobacteria bacterium]|nr:FAD-binding protein [Actinomycetota bacterium]